LGPEHPYVAKHLNRILIGANRAPERDETGHDGANELATGRAEVEAQSDLRQDAEFSRRGLAGSREVRNLRDFRSRMAGARPSGRGPSHPLAEVWCH
jgi:hypothetical protein